MAAPEVSVVIPTRGRAALLREAVASVAADQSAAAEVVVVENGSEDVDEAVLRTDFAAVRVVRLPPVGRSLARNEGARLAAAPLVVFLDSDDLTLPGRFGRQVRALRDAAEAILSFGRVLQVDERGRALEAESAFERERFDRLIARGLDYESILLDCPIYTSTVMVRRDAFLEAGGYLVSMDGYEDLELYLRLADADAGALVAYDGEPLAAHRVHVGNTPSDHLFACSVRLVEQHAAHGGRSREARRLLLERELEGRWGLGDFAGVRARARAALRSDPALAARPRFRKRLLASALPVPVLSWRRWRASASRS